jgi:hypothetical protein
MKKNITAIICGIALALTLSFFLNKDGLVHLRFKLGLYDKAALEKSVEDTLKLFNKNFATLFNTGGETAFALNAFPAENMIKRRVFQEINEWNKKNRVLVYDKDVFELEETVLLSTGRAVAVAREVWFLNVQNRQNRREKSGVKASPIRVRYYLEKVNDRWKVMEFEVFGKDDAVPPMRKGGIWS